MYMGASGPPLDVRHVGSMSNSNQVAVNHIPHIGIWDYCFKSKSPGIRSCLAYSHGARCYDSHVEVYLTGGRERTATIHRDQPFILLDFRQITHRSSTPQSPHHILTQSGTYQNRFAKSIRYGCGSIRSRSRYDIVSVERRNPRCSD